MKEFKFTRTQIALAAMIAIAAPLAMHRAHAGAGWADNVDKSGAPFKQGTFYANSPQGIQTDYSPNAAVGATRDTGTALRKFVDSLPMVDGYTTNPALLAANPSLLGKHIPLAIKENVGPNGRSTTFPDADYYEIAVVEYREQLHSDLPAVVKTGNVVSGGTTLRGYVQIATPNLPTGTPTYQLFYLNGSPVLDNKGNVVFGVGDKPHYLGPIIDSQSGIPVRLKFDNYLPTGRFDPLTNTRGGDIFIPTDTTVPGAGLGPLGAANPAAPLPTEMYSQNRAMIHLHGGDTPWISDGQPHSWITPAGETGTPYLRGETTQNVPDMPDFGAGTQTYYYPNNQSSRMQWYHDHTYAATRTNVYAGIVSAFMIHDATEATMKAAGGALAGMDEIPLIYETKTFVPKDVNIQDAKWNVDAAGNPKQRWGTYGDLWFPHVYEANQNPNSIDGTNPAGRWDYGPWFWPVFPAPLALPAGDADNVSAVQEAYNDTPLINGVAYPKLNVDPKAYRFRLLNADGQRYVNLGLYVAEPLSLGLVNGGSGYSVAPAVTITAPAGGTGAGTATALIDATGAVVGFSNVAVSIPFSDTPTVTIAAPAAGVPATAIASVNTEVPMVPAVVPAGVAPYAVNTYDGRPGGIPNPTAVGPNIIQIGTEGGFLAMPNVIPSTPVSYQQLRRIVTVLNVLDHGLYVGPAERADFVVDFSQYAGKTLILYNDSPAPNPGFDARVDYYTGDLDQTGTGGAPSTLPGQGPNTRTMMRINVAATQAGGAPPAAALDPAGNGGPFATALPAAFAASQDAPIITQSWQNAAYGKTFQDNLGRIYVGTTQQPNFSFSPPGAQIITGFNVDSQGTGYRTVPTVTLVGGLDPAVPTAVAATAHAVIDVVGQRLTSIVLDTAGGPYISAPSVVLNNGAAGTNTGGIGASGSVKTSTTQSWKVQNKGIQELFDQNYGRMNATFSVELPFTSVLTQTTIPVGYVDPPTEQIADGETQIWKVTHNGVDTHTVHFHLFNVQVINRVGWDGTVVAPDPAEFGWKETVKMNPLEDIYVAIKPKTPKAPFGVPQSVRPLDPTQPLGVSTGFTQLDPTTGLATTVVNAMHNFDWEYIWHCHILGHEENDFMRVISFNFGAVTPDLVGGVKFNVSNQTISWVDPTPAAVATTLGNKKNENGFIVQRSDNGTTWNSNIVNGAWTTPALPSTIPQTAVQATQNPANSMVTVTPANATSWTDVVTPVPTTQYRVVAFNSAGYSLPSTTVGAPSSVNTLVASVGAWNPTVNEVVATGQAAIIGGFPVTLTWTSATAPASGYVITRTGGFTATGTATLPVSFTVPGNATTFTDPGVQQTSTYTYSIVGMNGTLQSATTQVVANTTWAPAPAMPAAPTASTVNGASIQLNWLAPASTQFITAFQITRTDISAAPLVAGLPAVFQINQVINPLSGTILSPVTSYLDATAVAGHTYTYAVQILNGTSVGAASAVTILSSNALPPAVGAVSLLATSPTSVTVSWPVQPLGSSTTAYIITRTSTAGMVTLAVPAGVTTSFVDTTVAANTSYTYSVQWVNGPNIGTASTAVVTTPYAAAGIISGLTGVQTAPGTGSATLNWTAPAAGTFTSFTVTRCLQTALNANCTNASTVFTVLSSTVTASTFVDTTVAANSAYTYQVIATNGPINKSAPVTVSVPVIGVLAAPAFTATPVIAAGSVTVTWVAGVAPVSGYAVQRSADNGLTWVQVGTTASNTVVTFRDATVVASTTYLYRIVATATVGTVAIASIPSATQSAAYTVQTAPVMAANVIGGTAAAPTVLLNWTETVNAGPALTGFQVYRDGLLVRTLAAGVLTYTDTTVPGLHTYIVLAMNIVGPSASTGTTTANLVVQAAPVLLTANMTSATATAVTWSETPIATAPPVTGYQVWASVNGAAAVQMGANLAATATSANVTTITGNSYVFSVKAVNFIGSSVASNTISLVDQVQAAPVQAAAVFNSPTAVTLSWSEAALAANPAVTGFNVYNGATLLTATPLAATATSYVATTALGSAYSFTVKAVNVVGLSVASNAVVFSDTVPTTVATPTATLVSPTSTTVSWKAATVAAGAPAITGYNVYNGTTLLNATPLAATATSYAATTVAGTNYSFTVQAVNLVGSSIASAAVVVSDTVPTRVATPTAIVVSPTSTTVSWTAATVAANAPAITGYNVYNGATLLNATPLAATATSYAAATVVGSSYSFTVQAVSLAGSSIASTAVSVSNTVPTTVATPTTTFVSATSTTVSWTAATVAAGAPAITGYNVYNGTTLLNATPLAATAISYAAATVAGTAYSFNVKAVNIVGASAASTAASVSNTVPNTVATPTASVVSPTSTTVSWTASTVAAGAPAITGYNVYNGTTLLNATPLAATATSYAATTVVGTAYSFNVKAVNLAGASTASTAVSVSNTVPTTVATPTATIVSPTSITVSWTAATVAAGAPAITRYNVYNGATLLNATPLAATATSYTATTVAGSTFSFTVKAVNLVGLSAASTAVSISNNVPSTVATPTATIFSPTQTTVTWTPATVTAGASPITGYNVYNGTTLLTATPLASNQISYFATTVVGSSYSFIVRAVSLTGLSAPSAAVNFSNTVPTTVATPTATVLSPASTTVSWTAATVAAGAPAITGYNVYNGTTLLNGAPLAATTTSYAAATFVGTTYNFNVKALNLVGPSIASASVLVSNTVPTMVAAPTATFVSPTATTLSWTAATVAAGAPAITGYNVYNGTTLLNATPLAATATSYAATTVVGSTYNFNVKAVNLSGLSAVGANKTVVNTVAATPIAPTLGTATLNTASLATDTVTVNWTPPANTLNGQPVTTFYIDYATNTGFTTGLVTQTVTVPVGTALTAVQTATFAAVARGTTSPAAATASAYFRVRSVNAVGNSANGATLTVAGLFLK